MRDIRILSYDIKQFPFRAYLAELIETDQLENLHQLYHVTINNISEKTSQIRSKCEERIEPLQLLIKKFIDTLVTDHFGKISGFQVLPTLRFHFAVSDPTLESEQSDISILSSEQFLKKHYFNTQRLAMFHRDKDYGLARGSVNLWIPVTDVWGSNSLWIGGYDNSGFDSQPIKMKNGEALFFDGAFRWHGVIWNTTPITRVSFDIRFHPEKDAFLNA